MSAKSQIEKDFEETVDKINVKIREAAASLAEANLIAQKAGLNTLTSAGEYENFSWNKRNVKPDDQWTDEDEDQLEEDWEEFCNKLEKIKFSPLLNELSKAGWSTSSMYC